jgi:hypothetical protein
VLVIDSSEGFRSGDFVERYTLMRDRVREVFGARTKEMLEIFAAYKGDQKHAVGAKNEAIKWLREMSEQAPEKRV